MTLADTPTISLTVVPYRLVILASEPETIVTCIYRLMHKPPSLSADSSLPNDSIIPLDSAATVATSGCCSGDNSQTSHGVLSTFIEEKSWTSVPSGGWPGLRILRISASWLPCLEICAGLLGPSDRMASTTSQQSASGTSGVGHRCLTGQQSHRQLHNCQQKYHNPRQQQYQQFHQSHSRSQQQLQQAQQSGSSYLRFQDLDSTDYVSLGAFAVSYFYFHHFYYPLMHIIIKSISSHSFTFSGIH
ncbi:unnamed protein product [Protopolystoma xenopodis]|uniref:Uncharacterized protein n=1 Tax=Protopolystoma xenopodis TaxID=117903 RepID=A0A3S5A184_9PLAT|nr:unnamed protein product [Protopolystoma xenopodis]